MIFFIALKLPYTFLSLAFITKPSSAPLCRSAEHASPLSRVIAHFQRPSVLPQGCTPAPWWTRSVTREHPDLLILHRSYSRCRLSQYRMSCNGCLLYREMLPIVALPVQGGHEYFHRPSDGYRLSRGRVSSLGQRFVCYRAGAADDIDVGKGLCIFYLASVLLGHPGNIDYNMDRTLAIGIMIDPRISCHARKPQGGRHDGWQDPVSLTPAHATVFSSPNTIDRRRLTLLTNYFNISPVLRDHRSRSRWSISMPISLANRSSLFSIVRYPARVVGRIRLPITPISRRLFRMCLSRMA